MDEKVRIPMFFYILPVLLLLSLVDVKVLTGEVARINSLKFDVSQKGLNASEATLPSASSRPRVLLGIASLNSTNEDARMRRIIKHTYLDNFGYELFGGSDFDVCSLNNVKSISQNETERCRLVYTFLLYSNSSAAAFEKEPDAMFLPPRRISHDTMVEWFSFSADTITSQNDFGSFDYVMFATSEITFLPNVFLNENKAMRKYDPSFFGGMLKDEDSNTTRCRSQDVCLGRDFLALSSDLVRQFSRNLPSIQSDVNVSSTSRIGELLNRTENNRTSVLRGVRKQSRIAMEALKEWDKYVVESVVEFVDEEEVKRVAATNRTVPSYNGGPRMLIGIFTWNATGGKELDRRNAIRETYLSAYKESDTPNRICSLQDLLAKKVEESECELAYTFVYGMINREDAPTIRVNATSLEEMYASDVMFPERDGLYLNIRENMNEGKSDTWLKYAVLLQDVLHFDYVAKVDTDTLVFPSRFFPRLSALPKFPNNARAYGGWDSIKPADATGNAIGPSFMLGRFYWFSPDLARYVTSNCTHVDNFPEDKGIGNCVNSHPLPIQRMRLHRSSFEHSKSLKNPDVMRTWWKSHVNALEKKKNSAS